MPANPAQLKVVIGNDVALYAEKAPYVQSGASLQGVLLLDPRADLVQCHECGEWFQSLPEHVWKIHKMRTSDYKHKHGLLRHCALVNERIRNALVSAGNREAAKRGPGFYLEMRRRAKAASWIKPAGIAHGPYHAARNRKGRCHAQDLNELKVLAARIGRCPSNEELIQANLHPAALEYRFNRKIKEILFLAGLAREERSVFTPELLAELLRDFYVSYQRLPSVSDFKRRVLPSPRTFRRHFGSMGNAYFAAGLELIAERRKRSFVKAYTPETLEQMLRSYVLNTGSFPSSRVWAEGRPGLPTWKTYKRYIHDMAFFAGRMRLELGEGAGEISVA